MGKVNALLAPSGGGSGMKGGNGTVPSGQVMSPVTTPGMSVSVRENVSFAYVPSSWEIQSPPTSMMQSETMLTFR